LQKQKLMSMFRILLAATFLIFTSVEGTAQVRQLMLEKAKQMSTTKQQSTQPADTTQKATPSNEPVKQEQQSNPIGFSGGSKKDVRPVYTFNDNMLVEITNYKKDGKKDGDPVKVRYLFSKEAYLGSEMTIEGKKPEDKTESTSIVEFGKNQMVMLSKTKDGNSGFVMKYDSQKIQEKAAKDTSSAPKFTKTGRTKTILGYLSEEWVSTDEKGNKTEIWISNQVKLDVSGASAAFAGAKGSKSVNTQGYPQGAMLEMNYYEKNGEKTTWIVLEINLNKTTTISTEGYTFMGF